MTQRASLSGCTESLGGGGEARRTPLPADALVTFTSLLGGGGGGREGVKKEVCQSLGGAGTCLALAPSPPSSTRRVPNGKGSPSAWIARVEVAGSVHTQRPGRAEDGAPAAAANGQPFPSHEEAAARRKGPHQ